MLLYIIQKWWDKVQKPEEIWRENGCVAYLVKHYAKIYVIHDRSRCGS